MEWWDERVPLDAMAIALMFLTTTVASFSHKVNMSSRMSALEDHRAREAPQPAKAP